MIDIESNSFSRLENDSLSKLCSEIESDSWSLQRDDIQNKQNHPESSLSRFVKRESTLLIDLNKLSKSSDESSLQKHFMVIEDNDEDNLSKQRRMAELKKSLMRKISAGSLVDMRMFYKFINDKETLNELLEEYITMQIVREHIPVEAFMLQEPEQGTVYISKYLRSLSRDEFKVVVPFKIEQEMNFEFSDKFLRSSKQGLTRELMQSKVMVHTQFKISPTKSLTSCLYNSKLASVLGVQGADKILKNLFISFQRVHVKSISVYFPEIRKTIVKMSPPFEFKIETQMWKFNAVMTVEFHKWLNMPEMTQEQDFNQNVSNTTLNLSQPAVYLAFNMMDIKKSKNNILLDLL